MAMNLTTELTTLRNLGDATRQQAHDILKKLEGKTEAELRTRFEVNGKKLNSVYWQYAHMAWGQNSLILRSTGGPNPELSWLKHFAMGKPGDEGETNGPSWEEVVAGFNKVHRLAMEHLTQLDPAMLDAPNNINWEILGGKTMRNTIMHHIRHENGHIGQLFWLVNLHGGKTM